MPDSTVSFGARLLLIASLGLPAIPALAKTAPDASGPLTVHVRNDRMTLRVAKAPQVYLSGTINDLAVAQVRQWLDSGKLDPGADVYLDSSNGDVAAGMALGRVFRGARFNTHLGTWHTGNAPARPATCLDACAYAYLGGVYRWSPSGGDRIGLSQHGLPGQLVASSLDGYLEAMGVQPADFARVSGLVVNGTAWWNTDKLVSDHVANNGRLPLEADYRKTPGTPPTLQLSQTMRGKQNQVELQCAPGHISLSARYAVGAERTPLLAARAIYAYFEVGEQPWQQHTGERPRADGDALVFTRQMPFAQLLPVLQSGSLGVWFEITGSPVRVGFWMAPSQVWSSVQPFLADCQALQPGYKPPHAIDKPAKPSLWRRLFGRH
ncbi:MAG: hypothetical protein RSP_16740 [Rhodanobacter sp.]